MWFMILRARPTQARLCILDQVCNARGAADVSSTRSFGYNSKWQMEGHNEQEEVTYTAWLV